MSLGSMMEYSTPSSVQTCVAFVWLLYAFNFLWDIHLYKKTKGKQYLTNWPVNVYRSRGTKEQLKNLKKLHRILNRIFCRDFYYSLTLPTIRHNKTSAVDHVSLNTGPCCNIFISECFHMSLHLVNELCCPHIRVSHCNLSTWVMDRLIAYNWFNSSQ